MGVSGGGWESCCLSCDESASTLEHWTGCDLPALFEATLAPRNGSQSVEVGFSLDEFQGSVMEDSLSRRPCYLSCLRSKNVGLKQLHNSMTDARDNLLKSRKMVVVEAHLSCG